LGLTPSFRYNLAVPHSFCGNPHRRRRLSCPAADDGGDWLANERGGLTVSRKLVRYRMTRIPEGAFLAMHSAYELAERGANGFRFVIR
jgi:hypothetical protein